MSPRRKIRPDEKPLLVAHILRPRGWWQLPLVAAVCALVMVAAITVSTLMLIAHRSHERADKKNQQVVAYVKWFMGNFTSVDPFHANEYVTRVLSQATGDFAKQYRDQANEILISVAQAEPTSGIVLDAGVERWNDDGSANVLVATEVTSKSPDEKKVVESATRWTATAKQEGNQWKISALLKVI